MGSLPMESPPAAPRREWVGHLLVGLVTCALTVSIVGSIAYLVINRMRLTEHDRRIRDFVGSMENRSRDELSYAVQQLRTHEKVADRVLPMILQAAERGGTERQRLAGVELAAEFVSRERVEKLLFDLRRSTSETVAARAVAALGRLQPAERAADRLLLCLDVSTPAVIDVVCDELAKLGEPGLTRLHGQLDKLDTERRLWLAGLLAERRARGAGRLLEGLLGDADGRVRARAVEATLAIGGVGAIEALVPMLSDKTLQVRHAAARAIGKLSGQPFAANDEGVAAAQKWAALQPRAGQ